MPVFRSGADQVPKWCELEQFEIVRLPAGGSRSFEHIGKKEKLVIGAGTSRVFDGWREVVAETGTCLDLPGGAAQFEVQEALTDTTLVRMSGRWGEETGGCGVFHVEKSDEPSDQGDPVDYPKQTDFDNHFHDCDEYWIILAGRGVVVSEDKHYEVGPGDCVATGKGHHHDFPIVYQPVTAVYFETSLGGKKRRGHLWEHTHGRAAPAADRI